jgi:hypothetical protein
MPAGSGSDSARTSHCSSSYTKGKSLYNFLAEHDLDLFIDQIQTERTGCAGSIAGSIPNKTNAKDLEGASKQHPLLVQAKITDLELHTKMIRVRSGKLEQDESQVLAIHICTSYKDILKIRKIVNQIYPSKSPTV